MVVVPGRAGDRALTWWVLSEKGARPAVALTGPNSAGATVVIHALARPGDGPSARNAFLVATRGLAPDSPYTLVATLADGTTDRAASRTLPGTLAPGSSFAFALGSCYCVATDPGVAYFYPPGPFQDGGPTPIRLRILCGDQIYMDLDPAGGGPLMRHRPDPWDRYARQWRGPDFGKFLRASPNLVMADDHEFWNDYPHGNAWLFWDENGQGGPIGEGMKRAYAVFQSALNIDPARVVDDPAVIDALLAGPARTFGLRVGPIRLFLLDTRTERTRFNDAVPRLAPRAWVDEAIRWVAGLEGPGILVLSQPLVEKPVSDFARVTHTMGDNNLPDYPRDFARLWEALFAAPHDVLVLSGDIHWSRVYQVNRARPSPRTVYEVISSPLSKIPQGSSGVGDESGAVRWDRGTELARWMRLKASADTATYSTVELRPLEDSAATRLGVEVMAWRAPAPGRAYAAPLYRTVFTLA